MVNSEYRYLQQTPQRELHTDAKKQQPTFDRFERGVHSKVRWLMVYNGRSRINEPLWTILARYGIQST